VDPARDPSAITVLFSAMDRAVMLLALTELSVSALLHVIALLTPDVST
jgi:hypothetical protein